MRNVVDHGGKKGREARKLEGLLLQKLEIPKREGREYKGREYGDTRLYRNRLYYEYYYSYCTVVVVVGLWMSLLPVYLARYIVTIILSVQ